MPHRVCGQRVISPPFPRQFAEREGTDFASEQVKVDSEIAHDRRATRGQQLAPGDRESAAASRGPATLTLPSLANPSVTSPPFRVSRRTYFPNGGNMKKNHFLITLFILLSIGITAA